MKLIMNPLQEFFQRHKGSFIVLGLYTVLVMILTYPLILHFNTHILGKTSGDNLYFIWNMWWTKHALIDLHTNPFYTNYLFYPMGTELLTGNFSIFYNLLSIPFQYIFSLVFINNTHMFISLILSAFGDYLLVKYLTKNRLAAFVSGIIFAFCPYIFTKLVPGCYDVNRTEWIPLYVLFLIKTLNEKDKYSNAVIAGVLFALNTTCHYYFMIFMGMFTVVYAAAWFVFDRSEMLAVTLKKLALIFVVFFAVLSPMIYYIAKDMASGSFEAPMMRGYSEDRASPMCYLRPNSLNSFVKDHHKAIYGDVSEKMIFPGYLALALAVYALLLTFKDTKSVKIWAIMLFVFILYSLGSLLYIPIVNKTIRIYSYYIFERAPIFNSMRIPARFEIIVQLCLAVLAGYGINNLLSRIKSRINAYALATILSVIALLEYVSIPLPVYSMRVPQAYRAIASDKDNCAVLEIPIGWMVTNIEVGKMRYDLLYYQTVHGKKLLNGAGARCRINKVMYYYDLPVISTIRDIQDKMAVNSKIIRDDKNVSKAILDQYNIKYIVAHEPYNTDTMREYIESAVPVKKMTQDAGATFYEIDTDRLLTKTNDLRIWHGEGWFIEKRTTTSATYMSFDKTSALYLYNPQRKSCRIMMKMQPLPYGNKDEVVQIVINEKYKIEQDIRMKGEIADYTIDIDGWLFEKDINQIKMIFNETTSYYNKKEKKRGGIQTAVIMYEVGAVKL